MYRTSLMGVLGCAVALQLAGCSRQSAEDKAKEMATEKVDMAKGVGDVLQDKGTAAAESVATGVGKVLKGVERGFEKSGRTVALSEGARQAGLQATKVQLADASVAGASQADAAPTHAIEVYVLTERDAAGALKAKVFNALDQEIGRARQAFQQGADEGRYVRIALDPQLDLQAISRVELDFVPEAPAR
jgi:hypothetical protein